MSPLSANAAGLGKLTVTSALGEPLRAEIELVAVQKDDLSSIMARLASEDAFREAKIERIGALNEIKFSVDQKKNGAPILKLTTVQPVNEPFLDMLIELNWAAGRLMREYTVLLDPPGYAEPQSVQPMVVLAISSEMRAQPSIPPSVQEAAPVVNEKRTADKASKPVSGAAVASAQSESKNYGPVKKGETLNSIASQLKPEGYNLEQMLVALYQTNKKAFSGSNMNRLKSGQILRVPEAQQLAAIGRSEATHEVRAHTSDWNAYRQKLAAAVAETPTPKEAAPKQVAKGKITTAVEDKAAQPAPTRDVLKVTKGEAPTNGKEIQSLQSKLQSLQEETTAREKTLKDANDRIAALEKNIKEMQQLIELKNKNLADLQKQAAGKAEPQPAPPPVAAPEQPVAPVVKAVEPEAAPVEAPKPVAKEPVKVKPAEPPVAPGLLDTITDNPLYLAAGAGVLALLGGGALLARRRRKSLSTFEDSILTSGNLKANTVFGETAGGVVDTGDTSFLTDFSQAGLGTIDTNDVDPIAEAEVYMAYGRDAQAEEILKEAMDKDPNRHEIQLKLLEIYAGRKNLIAFETLAGELYAAIGGQVSPIWEKVAEMGRALDPNNPLYGKQEGGSKAAVAQPAAIAAVAAVAVGLTEPTHGLVETEAMAEEAEEDVASGMDFDLDETPAPVEVAAPVAEEVLPATAEVAEEENWGALEFDLGSMAEQPAEAVPVAEEVTEIPDVDVASAGEESEPVMEFDLGELMPPQAIEQPEEAPPFLPMAEEEGVPLDEPTQPGGMELDLDTLLGPSEEAPSAVPEPVSADDAFDLDFSLDLPESEPQEIVQVDALPEQEEVIQEEAIQEEEQIVIEPVPVPEEEEAHLDFDFALGMEEAPASAPKEKASAALPELNLSGISLNLEEPDAQMPAALDVPEDTADSTEAATKLDLARAYVEMGDTDGAREILAEVLTEGSSQQQAEANKLLASL